MELPPSQRATLAFPPGASGDTDRFLDRTGGWIDRFNAFLQTTTANYVVMVESPGDLDPQGILKLLRWIEKNPTADIIYGDEATSSVFDGITPWLKPEFSPERLRNQYYFGSLVVYSAALLRDVGGIRVGYDGAELYDLALRASRVARKVLHVQDILFWPDSEPATGRIDSTALEATHRCLQEHLEATGGGTVVAVSESGVHTTRRLLTGEPLVSIVIPTRGVRVVSEGDEVSFVVNAVKSIIEKSTYQNFEIVAVIDDVAEQSVLDELRSIAADRLVLVEWTDTFNFSGKVNLGAVNSIGDFLLILNDDVEVITPDWIESLLILAQLPGAGMSGSMLYYGDDTIQHAGHGYWRGDATHIGMTVPRGAAGPLSGYLVEREVAGVTAACAMMPAAVFREVGGLSTLLPGNFNDVDLCKKVTQAGHTIYWTPHAELYHFESKTRDASVRKYEVDVAWGRWGSRMHDPGYWPYAV